LEWILDAPTVRYDSSLSEATVFRNSPSE